MEFAKYFYHSRASRYLFKKKEVVYGTGMKVEICINGMEKTMDLIEEGAISRAKFYMAVVALALILGSGPNCVGKYSDAKGSDSNALLTAHSQVEKLLALQQDLD